MIIDGQNQFSDLANGDAPTAIADNASASVIDGLVKNGLFTGPAGGAYRALFIKAVVQTAFVSGGGGTIQAVLQDSADNVTYADILVGAAFTAAQAVAGADLFNGARMPVSPRRYLRVIYRIATAVFTAGKVISFLTPDQDVYDLSQRQATGQVTAPSGASDESFSNGVLGS